jgi:DNA end-binding protein Ku
MKAIWKGAISFGLVNIPVKLYSATQQSTLDLDMVDSRDKSHIRFQRVNEDTGKEVQWADIAKAYKVDETYVMLDDADFQAAAPEKNKIISIVRFVEESEIDTIYFENSYFVEPEKSGVHAYALMREALERSGKVGVTQFVMRTAEMLAVLKPWGDVLVLSKIRFQEEIRETDDLDLPSRSKVKPAELKMALALIDQFTSAFNPEEFKDEYKVALLKVIHEKAKGKKKAVSKIKVVRDKSESLMEQLQASLKVTSKKKTG